MLAGTNVYGPSFECDTTHIVTHMDTHQSIVAYGAWAVQRRAFACFATGSGPCRRINMNFKWKGTRPGLRGKR